MSEPESLLEAVRRERSKYGTPLENEQMGMIVNAVAWEHREAGWVLAAKDTGKHTVQPRTGTKISRDVIMHVPSGRRYDVMRDVEGEAEANWLYVGEINRPVVHPVAPDGEPTDATLRDDLENALRRVERVGMEAQAAREALETALEKVG